MPSKRSKLHETRPFWITARKETKPNPAMKAEPEDRNSSQRSSTNRSRNEAVDGPKVLEISLRRTSTISKRTSVLSFCLIKKKKIESYHYSFETRVRSRRLDNYSKLRINRKSII